MIIDRSNRPIGDAIEQGKGKGKYRGRYLRTNTGRYTQNLETGVIRRVALKVRGKKARKAEKRARRSHAR